MRQKPEKIMRRHKDGKPKFCNFVIVCEDKDSREQLRAAFEYLHYLKDLNTDFIPVNQLVHQYLDPEDTGGITKLVANRALYRSALKRTKVGHARRDAS